jgi:spore maturation protein CgeB
MKLSRDERNRASRLAAKAQAMNIVLLGKTGSIMHWTEDMAADLRLGGHTVTIVPTRDTRLNKGLERLLLSPRIGAPLAAAILRRIRRLAPDLVLAVGCLDECPLPIFQHIAAAHGLPPVVAWVGDAFDETMADVAALFDLIAYTDTGMVALHENLGFRSKAAFVPLAASRATRAPPASGERVPSLAFVAAPTPNRRELLAHVTEPVEIFGPGWQHATELVGHRRDARRIDERELAAIYASHIGVLNIRHAAYVMNGLNHRHFAPYIEGTPVISDAQPDIPVCFEPGTEMLVYQDAGELNVLYAALRRDPARALAIGLSGQRRVLASHTYAHRLNTIADLVGVRQASPTRRSA